jgi:hypothetical protein
MWPWRLILTTCFFIALTPVYSSHAKPKVKKPSTSILSSHSSAQNIARINLSDFGSHVARFGNLAWGNSLFAIFTQINKERAITCVTALSVPEGKVLWQRGTPSRLNFAVSSDIPLQVYDWNQDGSDDVIYHDSGRLVVLNGVDGSEQAAIETEKPYSLYIFGTSQFGGAPGLILHGRTFNSLLAPDLSLVWRISNGFSHFPMSVDVDRDGEPELLAGYLLIRSDGSVIWDKSDLGIHSDAAAYGDTDNDSSLEIAIATSGKAALLTSSGEILWRGEEFHAQHIAVGAFQSKTSILQVVTMDRDRAQSGILRMYSNKGQLIWKMTNQGNRAMLSRVDNWITNSPTSLLLVSRSFKSPPTLYDGSGRVVEKFPFPPASRITNGQERFSLHFAQHFDMDNDGREEIFIYNEKALWIYRNKAKTFEMQGGKAAQSLPNPRIFNSTFYTGVQ